MAARRRSCCSTSPAGFTFYYDEWNFLINRQEFTADALLRPHNEHNVMVAVLLFKGLWELVGLDHYLAFRLLVVALHLLCGGMLYVYARRGWARCWRSRRP